ncbi:exonuclease [Leclercia adecarboxylata]|uniref:exonuclease n=1 Tax=Leclercia adecarboxylata TaxID=83655 RepID=UPI0021D1187B|nr:exonuclease [Leclercia adecarboxylata]MCU6674635.1 3'-5' exoribonuclease [Leclercia adecarboxylata]
MEFFYHIKATQKSGKPDGVLWFTAKTESRAALQLDVELEDAGIETGRGKDYLKPVRTDFPVFNDLPEESTIDYTWCERYQLADDQRTWNVIPGAASQSETTIALDSATSDVDLSDAPVIPFSSTLLANRTQAVRFAVHILGDKYLSEISQEQQIVANEMAMDEGNIYFQNLLQAKNDVPDLSELSGHAEWKLVQAIKDVFPQDKVHEPALLAIFMSSWIKAEADERNKLVDDWKSGKLPAKEEPENLFEHGLRISKHDDGGAHYPVCKMPFRKQLLAQLTADELRHHISRKEHADLHLMEMDTDNGYVQNLLLAAENSPEVKAYDTKDLWRYTKAIREVFSMDKRHELALLLQFTKAWVATPYIDRGILTREWAAGNRINLVQRTDAGTNADGGYVTDRGEGAHHTLETLDLEIASALLPMDFNHREIPGSIARRAKEIIANKEEPWKSWSKILRNQPGILAVNRTAIFNLVRIAPENIHLDPVAHLEFVNQTMTAEFNAAVELLPLPAPVAEPEVRAAQPGGSGKTDRNPNYIPDFDGLDTEIALAMLSADFNIYDIPSDAFHQAKTIVAANDSPFKEWSEALRATLGILDYSRAAIFALIRSAHPEYYKQPGRLVGYIAANLTETDHEHPTAEMLTAARHTPEVSWESEVNEQIEAEKSAASQPQVANLGGGMFAIDGLTDEKQPENDDRSPVNKETTSDVQMEETNPAKRESVGAVPAGESTDAATAQTDAVAGTICAGCGTEGGGGCPDCGAAVGDATYAVMEAGLKEELEALGADTSSSETMFTHLMVDLETMGKKPGAPIVSVGAVFFDPASGITGAEYYQVINLESSMSFGARPDASTIIWWLKQSPEARSAIVVDDTVGLVEALEQLLDFIAENAANGSKNVQLWGNGSSFDCSLLEAAFELADTPFPIPHWNYRDVRTVVELGKAVGLNARYDIPFEGDQHNALADARHQVKYVSAIWQRLTAI